MSMISNDWLAELGPEFKKPYYAKLYEFVKNEYNTKQVFPPSDEIFTAFHLTPLSQVKVVIIGQDPYHNDGQAHGLCFSVRPEVDIPPSLVNIYQELHEDLGCKIPNNGYLIKWAKQGVLLLNATLTVRAHQANSHAKFGWQKFTDRVIQEVNKQNKPVAFILWGNNAIQKEKYIDKSKHLVLKSVHPSPLSAYGGFFGNNHFKLANDFLRNNRREEIDWRIDNI